MDEPFYQSRLQFRCWDYKHHCFAVQGEPDLETLYSFMHHYGDRTDCLTQWIGAYDCQGKPIYELDIVEFPKGRYHNLTKGVVGYQRETPIVRNKRGVWDYTFPKPQISTVIGNAFENPAMYNKLVPKYLQKVP